MKADIIAIIEVVVLFAVGFHLVSSLWQSLDNLDKRIRALEQAPVLCYEPSPALKAARVISERSLEPSTEP
jgi:hypothetical protein